MSVLVVGSMAYDAVETPVDKREKSLGGSAMYFSTAASYFTDVNLVAVVGDDFLHDDIAFLKEKRVNLDGLTTEKGSTFRWGGRYLENMIDRETLFTELGVFEAFKPDLPESYRNSDYIFLANIHPTLQGEVLKQVNKPKFVALDTMNFWITGTPNELADTLKMVDCLVVNDEEVKLLSGENSLFTGAKKIQAMGPQTLIIKKGEHGSILLHEDKYFSCPALPIEQVFDPTGAGDTFAGGFMGYLAMTDNIDTDNLRRAICVGTAMASFCVEAFSADRTRALEEKDIKERLALLMDLGRVSADQIWIV